MDAKKQSDLISVTMVADYPPGDNTVFITLSMDDNSHFAWIGLDEPALAGHIEICRRALVDLKRRNRAMRLVH